MKIFFKNYQSPGDILMLTAGIRDLKRAYPYLEVNVSTSAGELWNNNPYLNRDINENNADKIINIGYPLINSSDRLPYHFIHGFRKEIQLQLGLQIPQGEFKGEYESGIVVTAQGGGSSGDESSSSGSGSPEIAFTFQDVVEGS